MKKLYFMTGSQDLYGEETLARVAEDGKAVAAYLDDKLNGVVRVEHLAVGMDGDGIYELTSTADPIIPYIGGKPYYDPQTGKGFAIPMFTGRLANGVLEVIFTCRNAKIPVGDETLDHKAVYKGTILL